MFDKFDKLTIKIDSKWFTQCPNLPKPDEKPYPSRVNALKAEGLSLLENESKFYHSLKGSERGKEYSWLQKLIKDGTLSDKVSSYTLMVEAAPVYNLKYLEALVNMVSVKGKRECLMAMGSLPDLFKEVLRESVRLKPFKDQNLDMLDEMREEQPQMYKKLLMIFAFEDELKTVYKKFLLRLKFVSRDTLDVSKEKAVSAMATCLMNSCEEEQYLLENLVDKIGDPAKKVALKAVNELQNIIMKHFPMKEVIVDELERFIFKPNCTDRAKYYSLCILSQMFLSAEENRLANRLISIFFGQFKIAIHKGEVDTNIMKALLRGANSVFPYAQIQDNLVEELNAMHKLVHMVSFNIAIQAFHLIFQVLDANHSVSDRFYNTLYRKMRDPALAASSKHHHIFLNLVFTALKKDRNVTRVRNFVKRLLEISLQQASNFKCAILVTVSELIRLHPKIMEVQPAFESDSDEHYEDVADDEEETANPRPSQVHNKNKKKTKPLYDFDSRSALRVSVQEPFWELHYLAQDFHPAVSKFANQVLNGRKIKYSGDPLLDFTLVSYLDRFVFKNPKKKSESFLKNPKNQVYAKRTLEKSLKVQIPINSQEFIQQSEDKVPVEERFLYAYLKQKGIAKKKKKDFDGDSVCSDDFEELIDKMNVEDERTGEDDLNFAVELGMLKSQNKIKKKSAEEESEDEDVDLDDEEVEFELDDEDDAEDEELKFSDDEPEGLELSDEDFIDDAPPRKKANNKAKRRQGEGTFTDADEFSTLLEENAQSKMDTTTSEAFAVDEGTGAKQLKWEMDRDRFVKGKGRPQWKKKGNFKRKARR